MKFRTVIFIITLFCSTGVSAKALKVSYHFGDGGCSEYFALLHFKFKNRSAKWEEITDVRFDFGDEERNEQVNIVAGPALIAWSKAKAPPREGSRVGSAIALGSLAVLGSMIHNNSKNDNLATFLAGTTLLGLSAASAGETGENFRKTIYPQDHLLAGNILVPPGMSVTRWILFNTENKAGDPYIDRAQLLFKTTAETRTVDLDLKRLGSCGVWQEKLLPEPEPEVILEPEILYE